MNKRKKTKKKDEHNKVIDPQVDIYENAEYDLSDLEILAVDGCLVHYSKESGSMLWFVNRPSVESEKEDDGKMHNKVLVEMRMRPSSLKFIAGLIVEKIQSYESKDKTEEFINKIREK